MNNAYTNGGKSNTATILSGCSTSGIAARRCDDHSVTDGGVTYDDWFLPNYDEAAQLYAQKSTLEAVSGFDSFATNIWTSTEGSSTAAYRMYTPSGALSSSGKDGNMNSRPIRFY